MWKYTGLIRPDFAEEPGPGQESVWDYPRPPALVRSKSLVVVSSDGREIARTTGAFRILETASPPTYYVPENDIDWSLLVSLDKRTLCEWKGEACYWGLVDGPAGEAVGWSYPEPMKRFAEIRNAVGFYPARVDCFVDDEKVRPQPGKFYGGWLTDSIADGASSKRSRPSGRRDGVERQRPTIKSPWAFRCW